MQSRTLRSSNYRAEALAEFMFLAVFDFTSSIGKWAGRVAPQTGCSQQKPSELLTLPDLHVVLWLQRMLWLLVCFSLVKWMCWLCKASSRSLTPPRSSLGLVLSCIPQCCSGCLPLPAAKKWKVMFRVHWGRLQLSQDLFQLGMEADMEKWPWENTELSGAPQVETEAPYICKSLALGSFLSATQPLMTKEWIRRHTRETNSNLQFSLQTVISIWEERAQTTNCAWWLTFNDKPLADNSVYINVCLT